jgi:ParB/RepB/Spo0J family partition protein
MSEPKYQHENYANIDLDSIVPNPLNPRKNFKGPEFDSLVESVRQKGVLEPILVRPVNGNGTFQIVAGERRFRASQKAALPAIPAIVREMTDEEAFDVMTIENLHREDLNEVEEAECFKHYLDAKGMEAAGDLAQRTGIGEQYIRRRVRLLTLPKQVIDAWRDGKILYGHCEQLMRLSRKEQILEYLKTLTDEDEWDFDGPPTVAGLKQEIDNMAPKMAGAKFDTKQCAACTMNSSIQAGLFGDDFAIDEKKKGCCLNPACFKKKQAEWLSKNWQTTEFYKKYKTTGWQFREDIQNQRYGEDYRPIYDYHIKAKKDLPCTLCKDYTTVINIDLTEHNGRVCFGDKNCFKKTFEVSSSGGSSEGRTKTPKDHGPEFQDRFYRNEIRQQATNLFNSLQLSNDQILRLVAFELLHSGGIKIEFLKANKIGDTWQSLPVWKALEKQNTLMLQSWIFGAALYRTLDEQQIAQNDNNDNLRVKHLIAKHLGIDLARDWRFTKEYLQCKTIPEIVKIGKDLKIFDDPKVKEFAAGTLKMKKENWDGMKKKDLIRLFLDSGADLAGKVPKEILKVK